MASHQDELVFVPLGGLGEIGMNAALYGFGPEDDRQWILVDCGMGFGGEENLPGIDLVYPDLRFIEEERHNLLGIFITHAHEDHIGALVEMWPRLRAPVYATKFAIGLLETRRLSEPDAPKVDLNEIVPGQRLKLGPFEIEYVPVAHSIPESNALAIRTPHGLVVHTGDWKLDNTPYLGSLTSEETFRALGDEGVLALVCDSTNVVREGTSPSEVRRCPQLGATDQGCAAPGGDHDFRLQRRAHPLGRRSRARVRARSDRGRPRHGSGGRGGEGMRLSGRLAGISLA